MKSAYYNFIQILIKKMLRFVYQGFSTLAKANPLKNGFRFENQNLTWTFGEFDV